MYIQKMKHKIPLLLFDAGRTKKMESILMLSQKTIKPQKNYLK